MDATSARYITDDEFQALQSAQVFDLADERRIRLIDEIIATDPALLQ